MNAPEHITIAKNAALPPAQDYYVLRQKGVELIQQLGSKLWTDYNIHDPGITVLETLCYAITDLTYRASFPITDLLAEPKPAVFNPEDQTFFSARQILTTAPWTPNDYRKLLIDRDGIRNAWLDNGDGTCGPTFYADCKNDTLSYEEPEPPENVKQHLVTPKGLYNVLLELEDDEKFGDLNTGKIQFTGTLLINNEPETVFGEVRGDTLNEYSDPNEIDSLLWLKDMNLDTLTVTSISTQDNSGPNNVNQDKLTGALRGIIYISANAKFKDPITGNEWDVPIKDVPIRFPLLPDRVRQNMTLSDLKKLFRDIFFTTIFIPYLQKLAKARNLLAEARTTLLENRNLTEDFCDVRLVDIEEFGICSDLEITPETDIEQVLGEVYYQISEYFNPSIRFRTLGEMLETKTVDQIYDGPALTHGFIDDEDLLKTPLNRTLYASDIINLLMDIPGILSVKNFMLVRFDRWGNRIETHPWQMPVTANYLPRLYREGSKVLVFKNGLPFIPDVFELMDTLNVASGRSGVSKLKEYDPDLPIPEGIAHNLNEYVAVQNSLPLTYGVGPAGLPSGADDLRHAQAKQLKGYLLFFEQLLANYLGQLTHLKELFSLENSSERTYFPMRLGESEITGVNELYESLDELTLYEITENEREFQSRRNRFLDHLLARFGESFSGYALLLYSSQTQKKINAETLIHTKTSFLKQFPFQSAHKAQAFDYTDSELHVRKDLSGVHQRIASLLGLNPSANFFRYDIKKGDTRYTSTLTLHDTEGALLLSAVISNFAHENRDETIRELNFGMAMMVSVMPDKTQYFVAEENGKFVVQLHEDVWAVSPPFATQAEAEAARDRLVAFAEENLNDERFTIVEHILLRPHETDDALLEVCVPADCDFCGSEDPYSFRVTFVFNGESPRAQTNFEFRRFAEKTIRAELPAHILAKVCWVKKEQYDAFDAAYVEWLRGNDPNLTRAQRLAQLVEIFNRLRSVYPPPVLHDCVDGNDANRVFLNRTQL